jgi:hypothetical protein
VILSNYIEFDYFEERIIRKDEVTKKDSLKYGRDSILNVSLLRNKHSLTLPLPLKN